VTRPLALFSVLFAVVGCAKGLNAPSNGGAGGQSAVQTIGVGPGTTGNTVGNTTTIGSTVTATTDTTATTDAATTDATVGSTTVATTSVTTNAATTVTTGSGTCSLGGTMNAMGCPACAGDCPITWPLSWDADPNATYYVVSYQCLAPTPHTYQTMNTSVDLCNEVGMCNDGTCSFGAGPVYVQSCTPTCCGPKVPFNPNDTPIACGGGVCCG